MASTFATAFAGNSSIDPGQGSDIIRPAPLRLPGAVAWGSCAVASFHLAYGFAWCLPLIALFFASLLQLARTARAKDTVYLGWAVGLCIYGPQLGFFWSIFHQAAIVLWLILSSWLAVYLLLQRLALKRLGTFWGMVAAPWLWTGVEYFRSELYPLRFSWLNAGYLSPSLSGRVGMYGAGFVLVGISACALLAWTRRTRRAAAAPGALVVIVLSLPFAANRQREEFSSSLAVAGVQFEEQSGPAIVQSLDGLAVKYPGTSLFVLSEYAFAGPVPTEVKAWCIRHKRWLIAGGKQFLDSSQSVYRNTAFVIGPDGEEVFGQAKSRPIQFFDDGLPAARQALWDSPWGKIGLCICYDLSYTRVTDALVRQGARMIIVPTMDVEDWGGHEHALHARVAPVRASEYGLPIFRLCSSGISQAVSHEGHVLVSAPFPGQGQMLAATMALPARGGHLPIDRFLIWPCLMMTAVTLAWQLLEWCRTIAGKCISSSRRKLPMPYGSSRSPGGNQ